MTSQTGPTAVNEEKLMALVGKAVGDWGAMLTGSLLALGDKLGLFQALADGGPATSEELAARTGTSERYVREWLGAMAAGGYVAYDAAASQATSALKDGGTRHASRAAPRHAACGMTTVGVVCAVGTSKWNTTSTRRRLRQRIAARPVLPSVRFFS